MAESRLEGSTITASQTRGLRRYLRFLGASPREAAAIADSLASDARESGETMLDAQLYEEARRELLERMEKQGRRPSVDLVQGEACWALFCGPDGGDTRLEEMREALGVLELRAQRTIELRYRLRCSRAQITQRLRLNPGDVDPILRGAEARLRAAAFPGVDDQATGERERLLDLALREMLYERPDPFPEVRRPESSSDAPPVTGRAPAVRKTGRQPHESDPFANDPFAGEDPLEVSGEGQIPPPVHGPDPFANARSPRAFPEIPGYKIEGEIAKGNMGVVYRGIDASLGRAVAIKMMLASREADPGLRRRFQNEARALARLNHPNIVRVHDCGEHQGSPYIVMALIEGESLQDRLDREGRLNGKSTAKLGRALADALIHVHRQDVLHRDIKPLNVLVDRDERPLLTDFGLAKDMAHNPHMTSVGIGTPGYWPPEQAFKDAGPLGPHSDIYGLGATMYALLTGQPPYGVGSTGQILARMKEPIRPPSQVVGEGHSIDAALEAIVLKCLARRPEERYTTSGEVRAALELYLRNPDRLPLGAQASGMGRVEGETSPWVWAGVGAAVVVIISLAAALVILCS
ncbi:MAG: protein kinase [Planctomycetota bacterium]